MIIPSASTGSRSASDTPSRDAAVSNRSDAVFLEESGKRKGRPGRRRKPRGCLRESRLDERAGDESRRKGLTALPLLDAESVRELEQGKRVPVRRLPGRPNGRSRRATPPPPRGSPPPTHRRSVRCPRPPPRHARAPPDRRGEQRGRPPTLSAPRRRTTKPSASRVGSSSHWTSSTSTRSGCRSAAAVRRVRRPAETANASTPASRSRAPPGGRRPVSGKSPQVVLQRPHQGEQPRVRETRSRTAPRQHAES